MRKLGPLIEQAENKAFIQNNLQENSAILLFKYGKDSEKRLLIEQIAGRQKIRKKLPDFYENTSLLLPPSENLEQCTSSELAKFKSEIITNYHKFSDLTGGLGIDFIYFARNAKESTYVEPNSSLFELACYNFQQLKLRFHAYNEKAEDILEKLTLQDLIYIDPSRRDGSNKKIVKLEDYLPSIFDLYPALASKCKKLIIKCSPLIEWRSYLEKLPHCEEVWVLSQKNECKEICFFLNFTLDPNQITLQIKTYNLQDAEVQIFINNYQEKNTIIFGSINNYLYMPNSSIMKAGLMDSVAEKHELHKLGVNTNIYSSAQLHKTFPGRVWSVNQIHKPYSKTLKGQQYNVVSRNFFDKASEIEKKLKLKSGGTKYLIALNTNESSYFVEASLISGLS